MSTENDVRCSLKELPDSLRDAYGEIYKRILDQKGSAPRLALRAFRWIQCSYQPLRSQTLLDAIGIEIGDQGEISLKETVVVNVLLKICQNLLIFDKQLNVFRFAHLSVAEYLETELCLDDSHGEIAKVCLSLLCTPSFWDSYDQTFEAKQYDHFDHHLLLYSAVFWPWHVSHCGETSSFHMLTRLCTMLISESNRKRWLEYHRLRVREYDTRDRFLHRAFALQRGGSDPVSCIGVFGLSRMFTTIFDSKPPVEKACIDLSLLLSSRFGDLEIAHLLIAWGADPLVANKDGWTALHTAAWCGHEAVAGLLIDGGADVLAVDKDGSTPLHRAVRKGFEEMARLLIDRGADVLAIDKEESTPLHGAAGEGHEAIARLLIDGGAKVMAVDKDGSTPLHRAVRNGREAIAQLLIDRGANVMAVDKDESTPLHVAVEWGHEAVARLLMESGADISAVDKDGSTPLHAAGKIFFPSDRQRALTRLLIDGGADVLAVDKDGSTPLHVAAKWGGVAMARLLMESGADVWAIDKDGLTPLHLAAKYGHKATARLLIDGGADVSAADKYGSAPLHVALSNGSEAVARLLIDGGADASVVDKDGSAQLHRAAQYGHEAAARLLIDVGADVLALANDGSTPLYYAERNGPGAVSRLLRNRGAASAPLIAVRTPTTSVLQALESYLRDPVIWWPWEQRLPPSHRRVYWTCVSHQKH